jgi:spore photoproduct lyase
LIRPGLSVIAEEEFSASLTRKGIPHATVESFPPALWPTLGAERVIVARHRGSFLRPCPATPSYNCCGLNIFHFGQGCLLDCSYCVLKSYLATRATTLFGNVDEGLATLEEALKRLPGDLPGFESAFPPGSAPRSFRFTTGEFTDSLLYDEKWGLSKRLIELFRRYPPATLELKTKTASVDRLLRLDHGGRTVISFSVNAPQIAATAERRAPSLAARLEAAARVTRAGYKVGFHFDPIVHFPGWEGGYRETAESLFAKIDPSRVAWISLGCLRYPPSQKKVPTADWPGHFSRGEFILGGDGKERYPRPLRLLMYRTVLGFLAPRLSPRTVVYLCMESGRMWRDLFGSDPGGAGLVQMFRQKF